MTTLRPHPTKDLLQPLILSPSTNRDGLLLVKRSVAPWPGTYPGIRHSKSPDVVALWVGTSHLHALLQSYHLAAPTNVLILILLFLLFILIIIILSI